MVLAGLAATCTQRLAAVMLVTEARRADESNSPKRVSCACHLAGTHGSGKCGTALKRQCCQANRIFACPPAFTNGWPKKLTAVFRYNGQLVIMGLEPKYLSALYSFQKRINRNNLFNCNIVFVCLVLGH
jgi:hypothetical protein